MEEPVLNVVVVGAGDSDDKERRELTAILADVILEHDVDDVRLVPEQDVPASAKGLGDVLGALAVSLGAVEHVTAVIRSISEWASRNKQSVKVTIGGELLELNNASREQVNRIIDAWLASHAAGS